MAGGDTKSKAASPVEVALLSALCGKVMLRKGILFLYGAELLHVDSLHHFFAVGDGGLLESLTAAEFFYNAGFFKLTFEFLEGAFDEFAFFYLYDYHILVLNIISVCFSGAKLRNFRDTAKSFGVFFAENCVLPR